MFRNALQRFFYGRYGNDPLNVALIVLYLVLYLVSSAARVVLLYWVSLAVLFWALFRMFSRNTSRRRAENARFMAFAGPALRWLRLQRTIRRDKDHCYFKCPNCGQQLRVPKGKGKITVTCRSCGASFRETT